MHAPLEEASLSIGCQPVSTDRFVRDAEEWLLSHAGPIELIPRGNFITVCGDNWSGTDETLPLALAAAIKNYHAARLMSVERELSKGG